MSSSALPLKLTPASAPARSTPTSEVASSTRTPTKQSVAAIPGEISSPHELTAFVETLLEQLDAKFDEMSSQILDRMAQMSNRVDALENAIQDIISGDVATPSTSPAHYPPTPVPRRTGVP
ncbi:heat shock factor binding protein 1-domain-containing protein [Butyriboletus roseoflavus]|nr:heat shock factor binding protein 1-domain-containing protein [Butyriboletus roseoflavus]